MPWSVADVDGFKKGLSERQKRQWVEIANGVLARGGSEKSAIMQASGAVVREGDVSVSDELETEMFHARQVRESS